MKKSHLTYLLLFVLLLAGCRDEELIYYPMTDDTGDVPVDDGGDLSYLGMYVLNEGNMGSNKATLDFLDLTSGEYHRNIYPSRNPSVTMNLGDVGNDIGIYGHRLWMVINCSNKVEVADAFTAVSIGHVDIPNCRYMAFADGYAYVSSYVGAVNGKSVLGSVYKVDTTSLQVVGTVSVGYQPDELAVVNGKLYVANSGGYNATEGMGYDNRVSVVDLTTFTVERHIDVAPNLFRIRADHYGRLWVASRGDYEDNPSRLYLLEPDVNGDMLVTHEIDTPVADMDICGDSLYFYGSETVAGKKQNNYGIIHLKTLEVLTKSHITLPEGRRIRTPYGIKVHPKTHDLYIMDATNYVSSGLLFCFDKDGNYKWDTATGDIPGHATFLTLKIED